VIGWCLAVAAAQPAPPTGPLRELEHPRYVDEAGTVYTWPQVKDLADPAALRRVRERRAGRAVLKAVFAGATAVEVWGTLELAERGSILTAPLGIQAGFTGLAAVLLWAREPSDVRRDRALVVESVNAWR
jgi:hypothetical protein